MTKAEPVRLSDEELARARQVAFAVGANTANDVLGSSTRAERDKLFLIGLICLLLLTAKEPVASQLPVFTDWQPGDSRFLPIGLLVALIYYFFSFLVLSVTDFTRWRLALPAAAADVSEWNERLWLHSTAISEELQAASQRMDERRATSEAKLAPLKLRKEAADAIMQRSDVTSVEYMEARLEWLKASVETMEVLERYSLLELGNRCMSLARDQSETSGLLTLLSDQVDRWRTFAVSHRLVSLVVPVCYGFVIILLMFRYLYMTW